MRTGRRRQRQLSTGLAGGSDQSAPAPLEAKVAAGVLTMGVMNEGSSHAGAAAGERLRRGASSSLGSRPKRGSSSRPASSSAAGASGGGALPARGRAAPASPPRRLDQPPLK